MSDAIAVRFSKSNSLVATPYIRRRSSYRIGRVFIFEWLLVPRGNPIMRSVYSIVVGVAWFLVAVPAAVLNSRVYPRSLDLESWSAHSSFSVVT